MIPVMSTVRAITFIRLLFFPFLNVTRNASTMCFKLKKNFIRDQYDFLCILSDSDFICLVSWMYKWPIQILIIQSAKAIVYTPVNPSLRYNIPDMPVPMGRHKAIVAFTMPTLKVFVFSYRLYKINNVEYTIIIHIKNLI